ncbi:MAG: threonylcarbamoyl-AMP synthase [Candidatus Omnitrophica bacterium]|nr:threonylcarbamoyl-AMP synthase [Candidatus Omnitrophota bacterium]
MKPRIFRIDQYNIDHEALKQAAEIVNNRGLVAFPTETVYGLGANALDPKAVTRIFEAKKRPLDDPLIVHISRKEDLGRLAKEVPHEAERLIECFWPGPLTVVLRKSELVPDIVTTGLETVAIRMPSNEVASSFIEAAGTPIAAPSANLFGRPSPTTAQHVVEDLGGNIDAVIDGGKTEIGIESSVIEFIDGRIVLLRPGGIDLEEISRYAEKVEVYSGPEASSPSPGKYPQHYSPEARVIVVEEGEGQIERVLSLAEEKASRGIKTGIMSLQEHADKYRGYQVKVLGPAGDSRICASRLFSILREFDKEGVDVIIAEGINEKGMGLAVMNRLKKAAGPEMEFEF